MAIAPLPGRAQQTFDPFAAAKIEQRPGAAVPAGAMFVDDEGQPVRLGDYFGRKPVLLAPVYYTCPNLCGVTLSGLFTGLRSLGWTPGEAFEVVAISIDPGETPADAAKAKSEALRILGRDGAGNGVHFLTGDKAAIAAVTDAIGFRFAWDDRIQQFAHVAAVAVVAPNGILARWLYGVQYQPTDLRLALTDAGQGKVGSLSDQLLLLCYHYDPVTGRYGSIIQGSLRAGGLATFAALAGFIVVALRRERRERRDRREHGAGAQGGA
ncbi:MAG: SCO family protein [Rhodospirillales bacterium]|nr:SCO family protein [Rhodospirillales bacterium]